VGAMVAEWRDAREAGQAGGVGVQRSPKFPEVAEGERIPKLGWDDYR
jgi:hypothetical protein